MSKLSTTEYWAEQKKKSIEIFGREPTLEDDLENFKRMEKAVWENFKTDEEGKNYELEVAAEHLKLQILEHVLNQIQSFEDNPTLNNVNNETSI